MRSLNRPTPSVEVISWLVEFEPRSGAAMPPLVAETSVGRLARPCGASSAQREKRLDMMRVEGAPPLRVVVPDAACHAEVSG